MTLPVDHIHNLDSYITNEGEAFSSAAEEDLVSMNLWVPSESVAIHLIDPPVAPKRKWAELIPWILEDKLLQPIEDVHFVVCGKSTKGQLQILVVAKADIQNWQRVAKNSGVLPNSMYPDYMALPYEEGKVSIGWREGMCLVRYGALDGFAASLDIACSMLDTLLQDDKTLKFSISVPETVSLPKHIIEVGDVNDFKLDWQYSQLPSQCDLLKGEHKQAISSNAFKFWLPASLMALMSTLLSVIYLQIASANMVEETIDLENRLMQSYSRLFEGRRPAPGEVRSEVDKHISHLLSQRNGLKSEPMASLVALDKLMKGCGCQLSELIYLKEDGLLMRIQNGLSLTKRRLNVPGYRIGVTQKASIGKNTIELRLTPKKKAANS